MIIPHAPSSNPIRSPLGECDQNDLKIMVPHHPPWKMLGRLHRFITHPISTVSKKPKMPSLPPQGDRTMRLCATALPVHACPIIRKTHRGYGGAGRGGVRTALIAPWANRPQREPRSCLCPHSSTSARGPGAQAWGPIKEAGRLGWGAWAMQCGRIHPRVRRRARR